MKYFYYEPRTGTIWANRPERRNVYKLAATEKNREQLGKLQGDCSKLLAWLTANEVSAERPSVRAVSRRCRLRPRQWEA